MDEKILLNRDEKREIWQRVHDVPATARMNGQLDWTPEYEAALCRAQLAKVVEWMKAHTTQRLYVNAEFGNDEPIRVSMSGSDWQALCEAAGGERK